MSGGMSEGVRMCLDKSWAQARVHDGKVHGVEDTASSVGVHCQKREWHSTGHGNWTKQEQGDMDGNVAASIRSSTTSERSSIGLAVEGMSMDGTVMSKGEIRGDTDEQGLGSFPGGSNGGGEETAVLFPEPSLSDQGSTLPRTDATRQVMLKMLSEMQK